MKRSILVLLVIVVCIAGIIAVIVKTDLFKTGSSVKDVSAQTQETEQSDDDSSQSEQQPQEQSDDKAASEDPNVDKPSSGSNGSEQTDAAEGETRRRWPGGPGFPRRDRPDGPDTARPEQSENDKSADTEEGKDDAEEPKETDKAPEEDGLEAINLNNVEMKDIVQTIGDWTGLPIIPTTDEIMQQRITIYSSEKLPRDKALSLIYAAMRARGVIAEHHEDRIVLKPLAEAKLGSVPTLGVNDPLARIEDKSSVVEKFFRLQNYNPTRMVQVITPLLADYGHVTAVESTGDIAVIDTVENLLRIERIIAQLDVPESERTVERVFEVKNGDPGEIVQVLQLILSEGSSRSSRRSSSPQAAAAPQGGQQTKPATSVVIEMGRVPVRLIPVPKHNWIIATGTLEDMNIVEEWIKKLDISDTVSPGQTIIAVRYVDAREVAQLVNNTIQESPGTELKANIVVEALPQSKQIVVVGSDENRKIVEKLIAEIDMPSLDVFVEKTFKLKHADPDKIKENLEGLYDTTAGSYSSYSYSPSGRRTSSFRNVNLEDTVKVISYPTLKRVTVIASENNMERIEQQIEEWDVPIDVEDDQYMILSLKNSDPVKMVDLLSKLFSEDASSGGGDFIRMIFGGRDSSDEKKKIVGSLYGMLTFEAVPDTKKIIVISKIPEAYSVIEKLVNQLDSQEEGEVPKVITLKYADAEDLCDQLNAILNEPGTTATLQRSSRGLSVDTVSGSYTSDRTTSSNQQNSTASQADTIRPWWDSQRRTDDEMPASNLIGKVRFIPVARSKAILVLAPPEYLEEIEKMIDKLDQPGKQVMLKAIIVEVDHSSMTSLGVQLATESSAFGTLGENALRALTSLTNMETVGSVTFDSSLNINVLVDLLAKTVNAKVLNQPTLWTKDNEEAVFFKGQNIAFITGDVSDSTNVASVRREFDYQNVGVTLRIRPNITPEKAVDLTINLEISQVESELVNTQIATNKLDTTTNIIIDDGQTLLLGGILFQQDSDIRRKVPLLGDLPIAGGLFSHEQTIQRNNELLVFITPYVIDDDSPEARQQIEEPKEKLDEIVDQLGILFDDDQESENPQTEYEQEPVESM